MPNPGRGRQLGHLGVLCLLVASPSLAQPPVDGHLSLLLDSLPNTKANVELRTRLLAERTFAPGDRVKLNLSGFVEGLVADRGEPGRDAIVRLQDVYVDFTSRRFDLRAGFTRIVWGRLDELQPGDVINPLDVSKFLLEGRSEARMPVAVVRARWTLPHETTIEGVVVPTFRSGRFDQLDEPTSPFNLLRIESRCMPVGALCLPVQVSRRRPPHTVGSVQGGARINATTKRVDWAIGAFRGFEPFGFLTLDRSSLVPLGGQLPSSVLLVETFPRFTMVSGDFETVRHGWGFRGEVAAFVEDNFQSIEGGRILSGPSLQAGIGVDSKAGDYRLAANVLVESRRPPNAAPDTDTSFIAVADRSFARETRRVRMFAVYNAAQNTLFVRNITSFSLRDNLSLEGSVGWFIGQGGGLIGQFEDRDFLYVRFKAYF